MEEQARTPKLSLVNSADRKAPEIPPLVYTPGHDLYNRPMPKTKWIVEGLIPRGAIFCLNGRGGCYKSWTFTSLAIAAATGTPFIDHFKCHIEEPKNSVMFVQLEETPTQAQRKYRWLLSGIRSTPKQIHDMLVGYVVGQPFRVDDPKRMDQMKVLIDDVQPDLVLWDNARKMKRGTENDSEWGDEITFRLRELQAVYPSAHGLIHHWRKKSGEAQMNDPSEMGRGSGALRDGCDVWLPVELAKEGFLTMYSDKTRDGAPFRSFNYKVLINDAEGMAGLDYIGVAGDPAEGCGRAIIDLLRSDTHREWTRPEIARLIGSSFTDDQVRWALIHLERSKIVEVVAQGRGRTALVRMLPDGASRAVAQPRDYSATNRKDLE